MTRSGQTRGQRKRRNNHKKHGRASNKDYSRATNLVLRMLRETDAQK